jgi:dTDP-4-amino-4,6-dideoxy-D-glucose transaminase
MSAAISLAVLGAVPAFAVPLRTGEPRLPSWERLESALRGIFERRFFANGGPLVRELDAAFPRALGVAHGVCVTNECVGMLIVAKALECEGEALVPAFAPPGTVEAVAWAGLTPVICDVDERTGILTAEIAQRSITSRTVAIVGFHLFGRGGDPEALETLAASRGLGLIFDASQALGGSWNGRPFGAFGNAEVFSFHESAPLNGAEGACITTNDGALATRLQVMRNFGVSDKPVPLRVNGKMAEGPPALALLGLEDLHAAVAAYRTRFEVYETALAGIPGITLFDAGADANRADVVIGVDKEVAGIDRDSLGRALRSENVLAAVPRAVAVHRIPYFARRLPAGSAYPVADRLARTSLALPNGPSVEPGAAARVAGLVRAIVANAPAVLDAIGG